MGTNTGIGIGIGIPFKNNALGGDRPYLPPELKARLIGVWDNYGKKNTDADRNIIKNKIPNAGGDLEILNAAYKLNSGFGKYKEDFTSWRIYPNIEVTDNVITTNGNFNLTWFIYKHSSESKINEMNIKVSGIPKGGKILYLYISDETANLPIAYTIPKDGIYHLPESKINNNRVSVGFTVESRYDWNNIRIEQIPSFEGAFVTDGIDDLITSTKTVQEMGITDEITVVSMIHKISSDNNWTNLIGELKGDHTFVANRATNTDKTGIYGYTYNYVGDAIVINNILGDKNDYIVRTSTSLGFDNKYYVTGFRSVGIIQNISQVAWYWTFIANRVLTTDEINQVIAYFNLDKYVKPDIYYNVKKQGLTNDTPDEDWYLKDFSGNGRDMMLYNYARTLESGINEEGGLQSDGVVDYGQFVGDLGLKDYTVVIDRAYNNLINNQVPLISSNIVEDKTPFIVEHWNTGSNAISFSYGASRTTDIPLDINKKIVYQSTYSYMGYVIPKGNAISTGNGITLGKFGNGVQYSAICLWSLMLFPYSMSEFLIERQLKKHKLGTLYPDMVEFRPVIKANNDYEIVYTAIIKPNNWQEISIGDYVTVGEPVAIQIKLNNPLEVTNVSSNSLADVSFYKEETGDNVYTIYGRLLDGKSPQKITMTIEQDENYVKFEPVITSNVEYVRLDFYLNNYQKRINIGDYIPKDAYIRANFYLKNNVDELTVFTFNGVNIDYRRSSVDDTAFNIGSIYNYNFPQEVNITIDEYIRFEDIVQPYPALLRFNDENGNEVSWGGKFKVGSTITRIGSAADSNLLPNIYNIFGLLLNGNQVTSSKVIVEKTMVFKVKSAYIFDNNEPKCILSPKLLRIPNSSYKILGYIPDISGHGNHGKINNSAYAGASGANGYPYDYNNSSFWCDSVLAKVVSGELVEYFAVKNSTGFSNITSGVYKGEIKVTGVTKAISENKISRLRIYTNSTTDNELIDITQDGNYNIDIKGVGDANRVFFYAIPNNPNESIVVRLTEPIYIEQVGEYEGAYCLDGVDDFVTIPTLSSGGKQVLMKVNWNTINSIIYDQRGSGGFAIYCSDYNNPSDSITVPAYKGRNAAGTTYIDGIRNEYIIASQLRNVTHNIVEILDTSYAAGKTNPIIGKSHMNSNYGNLALYDFMLFDNISTDDKIKELNEYVGIEAKVELPPYYWDTYGKTNSDADRDTIQQRGIAVGDYDLTNYNHAYNKISGYGGYSFKSFNDSQDWNIRGDGTGVEIVSRDGYSITIKKLIQNLDWQISNNEYKYPTILDKELPFKCVSNKKVGLIWQLKYKTEGATSDTNVTLINQQLTPNVPLEINLPYKTQDELTELGAVSTSVYYLLYFSNTTLEIGEEYTVEMLPLYPNGLLYDAVTDYSENVNIPVFTDFTAIMKRKWLKNQGCPLIKGSKVYEGGNGNALLFEWDKAYNFVFYKRTDIMEGEVPENISFITPTNYNGNVITRGSGQDTNGICIAGDGNAGFANMVFYKLILYPKTIPLLQINFLKNLMEIDEIIDLNNPIFIKNE